MGVTKKLRNVMTVFQNLEDSRKIFVEATGENSKFFSHSHAILPIKSNKVLSNY